MVEHAMIRMLNLRMHARKKWRLMSATPELLNRSTCVQEGWLPGTAVADLVT